MSAIIIKVLIFFPLYNYSCENSSDSNLRRRWNTASLWKWKQLKKKTQKQFYSHWVLWSLDRLQLSFRWRVRTGQYFPSTLKNKCDLDHMMLLAVVYEFRCLTVCHKQSNYTMKSCGLAHWRHFLLAAVSKKASLYISTAKQPWAPSNSLCPLLTQKLKKSYL